MPAGPVITMMILRGLSVLLFIACGFYALRKGFQLYRQPLKD